MFVCRGVWRGLAKVALPAVVLGATSDCAQRVETLSSAKQGASSFHHVRNPECSNTPQMDDGVLSWQEEAAAASEVDEVTAAKFTLLQTKMRRPKEPSPRTSTNGGGQGVSARGAVSVEDTFAVNDTDDGKSADVAKHTARHKVPTVPAVNKIATHLGWNSTAWTIAGIEAAAPEVLRRVMPVVSNASRVLLPLLQKFSSEKSARLDSGRTQMTDPTLVVSAGIMILSVSFAFWCICLCCNPFGGHCWEFFVIKHPFTHPDEPESGTPMSDKWNVGIQSTPGQCRWFSFPDEAKAYEFYNHTFGWVPRIIYDSHGNEVACATFNWLALNNIRRQSRIPCVGVQPGKWMVAVRHCTARNNILYAFDDEFAADHFLTSFNHVSGILLSPQGEEIKAKGHNPIALRALRHTYKGANEERRRNNSCC